MSPLFLTDFGLFVGRFHPLVVHLPIGFLLLAAILEFWPGDRVRPAIRVSWVLGALGAIVAAVCGWLLSAESGGGDTLFWHKWLGISVAVLAVLGVFITNKGGKIAKGFGVLVVGLLSFAGHQGGNLTHGEDYLFTHAPEVVQKIAGHEPAAKTTTDWSGTNTDSVNLYYTFLQPAINESCARCHNAGKQNGGLRMDGAHHLFLGGDGGSIIAAGDPLGSEWVRRVTLPHSNVKAMPPQGEGWDYTTVELLKYWIAEGADTLAVLDPKKTPDAVKALLQRDYGLDLRPKQFVEKVKAPVLGEEKIAELRKLNWSVDAFTPRSGALEVKVQPGKSIDAAALTKLAEIAPEQVVYLSLDNAELSDAELSAVAKFKNLNRLRLSGTRVGMQTVKQLAGLRHLESLNLYNTGVDDEVFEALKGFPALRRVYLWQSKVTPGAAEAFAEARPRVEVNTGISK